MTYKPRGSSSPGDPGHGGKTVHRFWFDDDSDNRPRVSVEISIRDTVALSGGNESEILNSWRNSFPNLIEEALVSREFEQQMLFTLLEEDFHVDNNPFRVALAQERFRVWSER